VESYFREGKIKEIADYCETDVVGTMWLRYELFRGTLGQDEFEAIRPSVRPHHPRPRRRRGPIPPKQRTMPLVNAGRARSSSCRTAHLFSRKAARHRSPYRRMPMRRIVKAVFLNAMLAIAGNDVRAQGVRLSSSRFVPLFSVLKPRSRGAFIWDGKRSVPD
jgi:hypothetical protein